MRLSREKIQRMIDARGGSSSGGGGGSDIAGGVTQAWVNQNYVSIEFFRKVFKVWAAGETSSDPDVEIMPNDITTTVKNIQAQAGLWTEAFLSALGRGSGGGTGGATTLDQLDDVVITSPTNGQALIYNATTQMWVNGTIQSGTDMATVWSALAAATNEQINASHLSGVLADYVTTTSLQTILGDYLTQNAADQRYITIAYFDRLFRAYNGDTLVSHNDTTTTIDNIKAMFGFWTDLYISALGRNSAATGLGIDNLTDVTINTPTDGQVLQYNATSSKWENATIQTAVALSGLTDVLLTTPADGEFLMYDSSEGKWVNMSLKTINSQSLIGTGDISVGGGASGNYLPLTGGTLTGQLHIKYSAINALNLYRTQANNATAIQFYPANQTTDYWRLTAGTTSFSLRYNSNYLAYVLTSGVFGICTSNPTRTLDVNGEIGLLYNDTDGGKIYANSSNILYIESTSGKNIHFRRGGTDSSDIILTNGRLGPIAASDNLLDLGSSDYKWNGVYANQGFFYSASNPCIQLMRTASGPACIDFYGNNQDSSYWRIGAGTSYFRVLLGSGEKFRIDTDGNVGINTNSPSYKLHVDGTIYATGAITALSDARKKDITGEAGVTVEQIAHAPAVQFLWKDKERRKDGQQVGTLAQYWQTVLPEVVMDKGSELSMQYGVAALVSAITIARKVVDHERRIAELEKENEELKKQLNAA